MNALALQLPYRNHGRLKAMGKQHGVSLSRLLYELQTQALVEFDAETRFKARQRCGANRVERGMELLRFAQGLTA